MASPSSTAVKDTQDPLGDDSLAPAVCRAGYLQFSSNRRFTNTHVQSRAFFWCKSGRGRFLVNGTSYELEPQDLYLLPWDRTIRYLPDSKDPMYTGHVHLIPYYRPGSQWIPNVPHTAGDVAFNSPDRRDANWPILSGVTKFRIQSSDHIGLLLDYIIRCYLRAKGEDEQEARHLGNLLVSELRHLQAQALGKDEAPSYPEELIRLLSHVESAYMRSLTVAELSDVIGRSRSHVLKLFRNHLGISAKGYIIKKQLKEACELLLNTTRTVAEIGQSVGIADPYHFSKLFRRHLKMTPTAYRLNHGPAERAND